MGLMLRGFRSGTGLPGAHPYEVAALAVARTFGINRSPQVAVEERSGEGAALTGVRGKW